MSNTNDIEHKIDAFILDQLSPTERQQFEFRINNDQTLAEKVRQKKIAHDIILANGQFSLKQHLQVHEKKKRLRRYFGLFLLTAIIITLVALVYYNSPIEKDKDDVYYAFFEPYPAPTTLRSESSTDDFWASAVEAYQNSNFESSSILFKQALNSEITSETINEFYLALSLMAQKKPDFELAKDYLLRVANSDSDYRFAAKWYLALCRIKLNEIELAKATLTQIIESDSFKKEQAKMLISKLNDN